MNSINFLINSSNIDFLTTSFFATSLSLLKPTRVVSNLQISNQLISDFKQAKSGFLAKFDVSTHVGFFRPDFLA